MTAQDTAPVTFGMNDVLAPLWVYSNVQVPEAIVSWTHSRGEVALVPYLDVPELAPPASDVLVVIHALELAAAAALIDEVLPTRSPEATVQLVVASMPLEVDRALLRAHLGDVGVDAIVDLGQHLVLKISRAPSVGDLPETLWTLTRSLTWLKTSVGEPHAEAQPSTPPVGSASKPREAAANAAGSRTGDSSRARGKERSVSTRARRKLSRSARNRVGATILAIAAVVLGVAAVVLSGDPGIALGVAACLGAIGLVLLVALLTRRAVLVQGKRIARIEKALASESVSVRQSLRTIQNDVTLIRSHGAIMLESLNELGRNSDGPSPFVEPTE